MYLRVYMYFEIVILGATR